MFFKKPLSIPFTLKVVSLTAHSDQKSSIHRGLDGRQKRTSVSAWLGKFSVGVFFLSCLNSLLSVNFSTTATQIILGAAIIKPAGEEREDHWDFIHWQWVIHTVRDNRKIPPSSQSGWPQQSRAVGIHHVWSLMETLYVMLILLYCVIYCHV